MTELLKYVASWPSLVLVIVVFGFAPGFCLRLIVLAYPHDDPRRAELVAELYAVPRPKRPLWVAEQLEAALFEGLVHRMSTAIHRLTGRRRARRKASHATLFRRYMRRVSILANVAALAAAIFGLFTQGADTAAPWIAGLTTGVIILAVAVDGWPFSEVRQRRRRRRDRVK
jgi:hypothetical protein